jgi:carbamoyl-phosphate synthase large subunit
VKVLVFGAGGPAGINVVRSLVEAKHKVVAADSEPLHLPWARHYTKDTVLIGTPTVDLINDLKVDAIHAQPEELVLWIAQNKEQLEAKTLCPSQSVVLTCQDKLEACLQFRRADLRKDRVLLVQDELDVFDAADELGLPLWIRGRYGAGARGSALAHSVDEAKYWVQYWQTRDPQMDFLAEEFLPGKDFAWTSLWSNGMLIASFGRERLEYIYPRLAPSGRTGTPTIAKSVHNEVLNETAIATVLAVDPEPHGFYSVDLREDVYGVPRPTEINAGRCFTTSYFSTAAGVNFMDLWCKLLADEVPRRPLASPLNSIPADLFWMRHIDCPELLLQSNLELATRLRSRGRSGDRGRGRDRGQKPPRERPIP